MTVSATTLAKNARVRFRAIAWLVLLAFALQSFVAQTHIHGAFAGSGATAVVKLLTNGSSHGKRPAHDSTSNCPLCQAVTHAGAFSAPSAPGLILPVRLAEVAGLTVLWSVMGIVSLHPWHSRAPPQN